MSSEEPTKGKGKEVPEGQTSAPDATTSEVQSGEPAIVITDTTVEDDKGKKSRNATIQARHRAKQKAYVTKLEQTLQSLRATLHQANSEARMQELETENQLLTAELQYLQAQLEGSSSSDDGSIGPAGWAGMPMAGPSNLGQSGSGLLAAADLTSVEHGDEEEWDEDVDPAAFGLQGWSPKKE